MLFEERLLYTQKSASHVRRVASDPSLQYHPVLYSAWALHAQGQATILMSEPRHRSHNTLQGAPERQVNAARNAADTAPARCLLYALCSDLAASPFDADPAVASREISVSELGLPYTLTSLEPALREWQATAPAVLKREYSSLFEVGSSGPPVPIREDLHRNQPAGVREDIVRFYEFFGYQLAEHFAWAPDHLSVELEFMHFLIYQEAQAQADDALSFQLAQYDFAERHLVNWISELAAKIIGQQPDALYGRLMAAMSECLVKDFEWQHSTIE